MLLIPFFFRGRFTMAGSYFSPLYGNHAKNVSSMKTIERQPHENNTSIQINFVQVSSKLCSTFNFFLTTNSLGLPTVNSSVTSHGAVKPIGIQTPNHPVQCPKKNTILIFRASTI